MDYLDLLISRKIIVRLMKTLFFLFPIVALTVIVVGKLHNIDGLNAETNNAIHLILSSKLLVGFLFFSALFLLSYFLEIWIIPIIFIFICKKLPDELIAKPKIFATKIVNRLRGSKRLKGDTRQDVFSQLVYFPVTLLLWLLMFQINWFIITPIIIIFLLIIYYLGRILNTVYLDEEVSQKQ